METPKYPKPINLGFLKTDLTQKRNKILRVGLLKNPVFHPWMFAFGVASKNAKMSPGLASCLMRVAALFVCVSFFRSSVCLGGGAFTPVREACA